MKRERNARTAGRRTAGAVRRREAAPAPARMDKPRARAVRSFGMVMPC